MDETREWEEGRVEIDIGRQTFCFNVGERMSNEEYEGEYEKEPGAALLLPRSDINFSACPFQDVNKMAEVIKSNPEGIRLNNFQVFIWIA